MQSSSAPSPPLGHTVTRHLSRSLRVVNVIYQWCLILLSVVNLVLIAIDSINGVSVSKIYFEIISVISALFPVIWSKFLDGCKKAEVPVPVSPPSSTTAPAVRQGLTDSTPLEGQSTRSEGDTFNPVVETSEPL